MKPADSWLIYVYFWFALVVVVACFVLGCRQPVRHYKVTTGTSDIWASQPKQNVEFTVEWTQ